MRFQGQGVISPCGSLSWKSRGAGLHKLPRASNASSGRAVPTFLPPTTSPLLLPRRFSKPSALLSSPSPFTPYYVSALVVDDQLNLQTVVFSSFFISSPRPRAKPAQASSPKSPPLTMFTNSLVFTTLFATLCAVSSANAADLNAKNPVNPVQVSSSRSFFFFTFVLVAPCNLD